MKKLILPLFLLSLPALAIQEIPTSISDADIKNRFMTTVKDAEVEKLLGASAEFNDCRDKNKFDPKDDENARNKKLKAANECFREYIGKNKDPKALEKLSEQLGLESYGLVKSKNTVEITNYLSKKMTKALTGRDPDEKSFNNIEWEKRKIVDQKVFIDLYTNQLVKSALYEVSRFCFENLRNGDTSSQDFASHWPKSKMKFLQDGTADTTGINDTGVPKFFNASTDLSKKEDAYKDVITGLGTSIDPDTYSTYFKFCQSALPKLCADFRKTVGARKIGDDSIATNSLSTSASNVQKDQNGISTGANSCLTIDRLQSIRTAMANTEKVSKQFEEMRQKDEGMAIQMLKNPLMYQRGKGANEESLDKISSMTSDDMLENGNTEEYNELETKCSKGNGGDECDAFLVQGDQLDKSIHNVESDINLKKEVELAKIKSMNGKIDDLEKYLTDNGHFDLLNKLKDKSLKPEEIEAEIGKIYDARKVAEIEGLKLKVGKRQVNEKEMKDLEASGQKDQRIKENIQASKEERARLAQVVMFNNIITSQLSLEEKGTGKQVGRNVNAWKKEEESLNKLSGIDTSLFQNISDSAKNEGSSLEDASVVGGGIIDSILGKKEDPKK